MAPQTIKLVVPVRFSGGGLSMQTTTSRIGAEGVFVRSLVPPIEGSRLELSLSLPGPARPVDAKGIVGPRTVESAKESGFWVQFDSLSDEARAFLDVLLRSRGGIFIATDNPPALREIVELSVGLPDGLPPVNTRAEVVHSVTAAQARSSGRVAGAGLQFIDAGDDFRQRLDACIEALAD